MNKNTEKFKILLNRLKAIANYFDEKDGKELLVALQDLISSLEQSEELVTAEQLSEAIAAFFAEKLKKDEPLPEQIENSIRAAVRNAMGTSGNKAPKGGYIASPDARRDFLNVICDSKDGKSFVANWKSKLIANGVSGLVYPTEVFSQIDTEWQKENGLFSRMTKISSKRVKLPYATDHDLNSDTLARGHSKGEAKEQQAITLSSKELALQMIYKWIPVDRIDLANTSDETNYLNFIIKELTERLYYSIERQVVAGGISSITSFESIGAKTAADYWTTLETANASSIAAVRSALYQSILKTRGTNKWLYLDERLLEQGLLQVDYGDSNPTSLFITLEQLAQQWNVERIIPYNFAWDTDSGSTGYTATAPATGDTLAVCLCPDDYYRVGGEPFGEQWTIYDHNQEAFMTEVAAGGGVGKWHGSSVVKAQ